MTSLFRILKPDFNPPPTVENAGIRPEPTPLLRGVDMRVVDQELRELSRAGIAKLEKKSA